MNPPIVRNLRFAIDESVPQYWHGGRRSVSIFLDNLSVFFPAGERFFVKAVRAHQSFVKDEALQADVRAFCGQEGVHGREHEHYNELVRRFYPTEAMEKRVEALLAHVSSTAPDIGQLGVTCALEHFTALLGHFLLHDPRLLEGAHPAMDALWRWHAAEENEHKTVAFDVFKAAGGTYGTRVSTMVGATVIFWAKVIEQQARMMKAGGILYSPEEWTGLLYFLFIKPGACSGSSRSTSSTSARASTRRTSTATECSTSGAPTTNLPRCTRSRRRPGAPPAARAPALSRLPPDARLSRRPGAQLTLAGTGGRDRTRIGPGPAAAPPRACVSPHSHAQPMTRAGLPATMACGGTSRVTTAPAPTTAWRPTRTGATSVALAPTVAPSSTVVRSQCGARGNAARGWRTLVNCAPGPTNTSWPSSTPSQTLVWLWMRVPGPMTAPPATKQNAPMTTSSPSRAPSATMEGG